MSPRKVAVVVDLIRGKPVGAALNILRFTKRAAAKPVAKLIQSAMANATDLSKGQVDVDALYVKTISVDQGPTLKRFMPRAMGRATIGQLGNVEHDIIRIGKAGKSRWLGIRPTVRGLAMNPVDHPHGGGEGKSGQGNPHPVSPWGQKTKGLSTRKNKRTDKFIVSGRRSGVRSQ